LTPNAVATPIVDYLILEDPPVLTAYQCQGCGARFFDRRNACAACGNEGFERVRLTSAGTVRSFAIVHRATPDVAVPFVSVVVELDDGKAVKANLLGVAPVPESILPDMRVKLTTRIAGTDVDGSDAITFGFEPLELEELR
jgi:uncharacterized protein